MSCETFNKLNLFPYDAIAIPTELKTNITVQEQAPNKKAVNAPVQSNQQVINIQPGGHLDYRPYDAGTPPKQYGQYLQRMGKQKWIKSKNGVIISESPWMDNKVLSSPSCGIQLFLDRIYGITTHTAVIGHADLGDDNTTVNASVDTGCINPLVRASIADQASTGNQRTFRFFFANGLTPDDTYHEFSMMTDGDATPGDGQGFNRIVMTTPLVKAAGEDHTIVCRVTGSV